MSNPHRRQIVGSSSDVANPLTLKIESDLERDGLFFVATKPQGDVLYTVSGCSTRPITLTPVTLGDDDCFVFSSHETDPLFPGDHAKLLSGVSDIAETSGADYHV